MNEFESRPRKVVIVGSGIIGRNWATLFASSGYSVVLYDNVSKQVESALLQIHTEKLTMMFENNRLQGRSVEQVFALISGSSDLSEALLGAFYCQECCPESQEIKQAVFRGLDETLISIGNSECILASSSSNMYPSKFAKGLKHEGNVITAHPINPPVGIPLVEIVPAPFTSASTISTTVDLMRSLGQKPIVVRKEVDGFVLNRLQFALLAEAVRLVEDEVASPEDIDTVVTEALGLRWSFLGPFATIDLNAPKGVKDYCDRYAGPLLDIVQTQDNSRHSGNWPPEVVSKINQSMREKVPESLLQDRRKWRDEFLMKLNQFKSENKWETQTGDSKKN
eukprot:21883_1